MQIWNSIVEAGRSIAAANTYSVVTIGNFDGVHRGHQAIIQRIVELGKAKKLLSIALTFANHTGGFLGERPPLLNPPGFRRELLQRQGLDGVLEVQFDEQLAKLSPELFFQEWLVEQLRVKAIVIGHDFKFGAKGSGNYRLLRKLGSGQQIDIEQIPPVLAKGTVISSSQIRHLIRQGYIELANEMLGYCFAISGEVVTGEQRGRSIGFPTANIHLAPEYLLPAYGVYLVTLTVEGNTYDGIASVGVKPTFGVYDPLIEVHLFDISLDLYYKTAQVEFVKFIRPEVRFDNADTLREQIIKDIEAAKEMRGARSETKN
jgi:riboflavin kinase/FMN adenylyltransferase